MFDIEDYLNRKSNTVTDLIDNDVSSIDNEIYDDIDAIISNANSNLYKIERFRQNKHSIDILYPKVEFPGNTGLIKTCNQVRFELSTYPFEEDLTKISKIVLRPKHIEVGGIELMALYLPAKQILVYYLFIPHKYNIENTRLSEAEIFMPYDITTINNQHYLGKTHGNAENLPKEVSPLFYLISTVSGKTYNDIDKFFSRVNSSADSEILSELDNISCHFYKYGY